MDMTKSLTATATVTIDAPVSEVWDALTDPAKIKEYMFGTKVVTDWKVGSSIVWKGVWREKPYEDKGEILKVEKEKLFVCTHFSPLTGEEDKPENYHTLTYELSEKDGKTKLSLSQDNNETKEAQAHSQKMWEDMLASLKKVVEG